jgi:NAD(P)-dependent dehydrogenase (short-subunit alcohol dehydrogenase family)
MASLEPSTPASAPKHYLIIGGTRGIGLQFVKTLLAQGHYLLATARHSSHFHDSKPDSDGSPLDNLVSDFVAKGEEARLRVLKLDVADEKSVEGFGERVVSALGGKGMLEAVVINAGVLRWPGGVIGG